MCYQNNGKQLPIGGRDNHWTETTMTPANHWAGKSLDRTTIGPANHWAGKPLGRKITGPDYQWFGAHFHKRFFCFLFIRGKHNNSHQGKVNQLTEGLFRDWPQIQIQYLQQQQIALGPGALNSVTYLHTPDLVLVRSPQQLARRSARPPGRCRLRARQHLPHEVLQANQDVHGLIPPWPIFVATVCETKKEMVSSVALYDVGCGYPHGQMLCDYVGSQCLLNRNQ